jgi:hypothetical protein
VAAGAIVQKTLRPLTAHPSPVRRAVVEGRVRSWPGSLIAAAMTVPSRTTRSIALP